MNSKPKKVEFHFTIPFQLCLLNHVSRLTSLDGAVKVTFLDLERPFYLKQIDLKRVVFWTVKHSMFNVISQFCKINVIFDGIFLPHKRPNRCENSLVPLAAELLPLLLYNFRSMDVRIQRMLHILALIYFVLRTLHHKKNLYRTNWRWVTRCLFDCWCFSRTSLAGAYSVRDTSKKKNICKSDMIVSMDSIFIYTLFLVALKGTHRKISTWK